MKKFFKGLKELILRHKLLTIICFLAIIVIVVIVSGSDNNSEKPTGNISSSTTTTSNQNYENEIVESINKSKAYVSENNFTEALAVLDTAEQLYGKDARIDEQRKSVNVAKVLNDASSYEKEKNYIKAIECIENSNEATKNNKPVFDTSAFTL